MELISIKRLEAIGKRVRDGLETCQRILESTHDDPNELDKPQRIIIEKLRMSVERLKGEIQTCIVTFKEATPEMEQKIEELTDLQIEADELLVEVDLTFPPQQPDYTATHAHCSAPVEQPLNSRLPKLEMVRYDGNILKWHEFWDQFSSVIESRQTMSDVDKLSYLTRLVEGDAKRAIEGLDITNSNYKVAVDRLTERFGKKGSLIDAHYNALQQIPKCSRDVNNCRRTLDEIERHLRTLQSLGENIEHKQLRATILEKFPDETMFDLRMAMTSDDHSVSEIRSLLEKVISARESASRMASLNKVDQNDSNSNPNYTIETLFASLADLQKQQASTSSTSEHHNQCGSSQKQWGNKTSPKKGKKRLAENSKKDTKKGGPAKQRKLHCIFCSGSHIHEQCDQFKTVADRKGKIKGRCFLCLRDSHFASKCPNKWIKCIHCGKKGSHNRSLCPTLDKSTDGSVKTNTFFSQIQCDTVLQTATILIDTTRGKTKTGRVLFDTGSQKTYVRSDIAKQMRLEVLEQTCLTIFSFGSLKPKIINANMVSMRLHTSERTVDVQAYTIPNLTGQIPSHHKMRELLREKYSSLKLAGDVKYDCAADIIIGNDYYHSFIKGNRIEITPTLFLINSSIGWIPSGAYTDNQFQHDPLSVLTYVQGGCKGLGRQNYWYPDPAIKDDNIKDIWELETIGIKDSPKVIEDDEVVQYFNDTTVFQNNRYQVKWPWIQYPPELPVNMGLALGRLKSLIRRIDRHTLQLYNDVLSDQLHKGVIETVSESNLPHTHPVHYLPHHCVLQPHKTTKLRIVYDASAKMKGQCSLNENLYRGPLLLADLTALLLKFRQYPIGVIADIEKAFLQIGLQEQDRDVTRFLWIKDITKEPSDENLIHLRFCRVPFGIIASPFLLGATIRKHLLQNNHIMSKKVSESLYVDNLVTGVNTKEEAKSLFHHTRNCFEELSMNIREWNSNSLQFLDSIPIETKSDERLASVLGLKWHTLEDMLSIAIQPTIIDRDVSTKREILQIIASVFDPCGFTAPLTLPTRLLLQHLWKEKIKWDTPLTPELHQLWEQCKSFLREVPNISLPRYHFSAQLGHHDCSYELHCFTDASKDAYVAVIYLRASTRDRHETSLVISRSRLTPLKRKESLTIPKLELLAVIIGVRLLSYVGKTLRLPVRKTFLWTDSQVVLSWLRSERLLPPFIAKRVTEIKNTDTIQFRYVRSNQNPADVATRQPKGNRLPQIWKEGPDFLALPSRDWPTNDLLPYTLLETDVHQSQDMDLHAGENQPRHPQLAHTSTTTDHNFPETGIHLAPPHVIAIQNEYFPDEQQGKVTPLAKSLGLYIDNEGILRCKGRFANAEFPADQKYPILLPKSAIVTKEIIKRIHEDYHHVGVLHTLSLLRQTYWVPQARSLVTKVVHSCAACIKYGGGPYQLPGMPALPPERVTYSPPFTHTGLDYFGPMVTTDNGIQHKRWGCIFTCMAVRAIHIELVDNLTTEEFLLAFRRFSAARGIPKLVVSDNAANFKLAAATLETSAPQCHWKFIPALSPWYGGFYERLVGLVKNCLRRTLDQSLLTDGQLRTVLHEIAATLNTRPLTAVSGDQETILTPSSFLSTCGPSVVSLTQPTRHDATRIRDQLISSWKKTDALLRQFSVMFETHYLTSLRERHQPKHKQPRVLSHFVPKIGDKVQIKGDSKNRVLWKVGNITSILSSTDGAVRTARVTLSDGTILNRSIANLYPLEMDVCDSSRDEPSPSDASPVHDNPLPLNASGTVNQSDTPNMSHDPNPPASNLHSPLQSPEDPPPGPLPARPTRAAARRAIQNIRTWTRAMFNAACRASVSS